jgi:ribitol-5-phosphate 2-dehydrogenase (NADP+)
MTLSAISTAFRLTRPFRIDAFEEPVVEPGRGELLLRPVRAGICGSDLKLYTGTRDRRALSKKLPIALLHEAVAEVVSTDGSTRFSPGERVVPSPSIPCTVAHPDRHPTAEEACYACRPGGVGDNYCVDGYFLSSNADGMARTTFVHPESCTLPVPEAVPETLAVLTEPLATVLAGLEVADPLADGCFLVLGNGALGLLTAIALRAGVGATPDRIFMTGHHWESRGDAVAGLATPVAEDAGEVAETLAGRVDVAFECVGGESNGQTLSLAIELLRPGGKGILFGPSETPLLFDTREVIAKGLNLRGCNRASVRHFEAALRLIADQEVAGLMERILAPKEFAIRGTRDLDEAMYHAWTKDDVGRVVTVWE